MLDTIRELVNFYSQKFHLSILFATQEWQINNWDNPGILIGMPMDGEKTRRIGDLKVVYNQSFGQSIEGEIIKVKKTTVAKVGKQFLILNFYPKNQAAETLVRKLVDESIPRMARFIRLNEMTKFLEGMKTVAETVKRDKESSINHNQWEIDRLSQEIHDLARKTETDRLTLRFFEQSEEQLKIKVTRIFAELNKLVPGLYSEFRFTAEGVIAVTQPITIWFEDYEYRFEPYTVEVNIQNGKISISGSANEVEEYIHPHISDGSICWGNIGPTISKLTGQLELHGLFSLIHNFLGSYNREDPYQRIEKWNPSWINEDCEDEPYCVFCDSYSHDIDDCELCWWCDACHEMVDHPEDECPSRREAEVEAA